MFAEKEWQRKLYARQSYLLVYESMDGFLGLLGKPSRQAISEFSDADLYFKQVQLITQKLNLFKKDHEITLKTVRHSSIAHRDKDMLLQLKSIESVNWLEAISIVTRFDAIVGELGSVCQELMNRSTDELYRDETTPKE